MVKYVYTLGASGERLKVEELDRTVEYGYDELYRLTSETITKGKTVTTYAYEYDNVSNRTLKNVDGVETVYTYNELNQLVSEDSTTYEYDNAGNLVRVVGAGKTALYVYNADNKLVKATVQQGNNVVVETYTYDYAGNRTSKTTTINNHVEKVYYLNDNSSLTNVLVEYSANGDEICYYTVGADLVSQEVDGKVFTYLYDGHGTVRALANENGKITDTYTYDAFGNLISSTGSTANNYRYCGEQFDSTTGLYYLRARYMDTNTGRFISQDSYAGSTADPISLHKYLYANSNPVSNSDPSGYSTLTGTQAAMAGMAAICGIIALNAVGIFKKLSSSLISVLQQCYDVKIKITEVLVDIYMGVSVCMSLCQRALNNISKQMAPGEESIPVDLLFGLIASYVYWQLIINGNRYGNDYEHHHIVPQNDLRAYVSQTVLWLVGIDIDSEQNLVWVKKAIHKFLHTTIYFDWVNKEISQAYFVPWLAKQEAHNIKSSVETTLSVLKAKIYSLNKLL